MIVVVGGGAAGGAAACGLAEAGREVTLIERETGPHDKICGEFLSHEACADLGRLGLDPAALGAAPIHTVRLAHGRLVAQAALPFPALGLSRRVLDEALLHRAAALGVRVIRGQAVRSVGPGIRVAAGEESLDPEALFLATGKHDLRDARRATARPPEDLVGFKMHWSLRPASRLRLRGCIDLLLVRGGYAGLQLVEHDRANLCLLVHRDRLAQAGGAWPELLTTLMDESPHLRDMLAGAQPLFERPLTIARVPYGFVHRAGPGDPAGLFRLGDQVGVIPSFCGDGIAIALHSARRAVGAYARGEAASAYHARIRQDIVRQIGRAGLLYAAGRRGPGLAVAAARLWPGLLRRLATATRLPAAALTG